VKLYDAKMAPNPRRVRIFLAEKGVEIPTVQVDIGAAENRKSPYIDRNPMGAVPVLELDDGTWLAESVAICRFIEETHPDPALMGQGAQDRAVVEMWNRRMEQEVLIAIAQVFRNSHVFFKGRIPQVPEYGEACRGTALKRLEWLDGELADREFIAGDRFSIADITALCGIDFGRVSKIGVSPEQKNLARWHEAVSARPSTKA
jgi:glutathione S-transferase